MSRQLKFHLQAPEVEEDFATDLVEINLNPSCGQTKPSSSAQALDQLLLATPPHRGYPYGYAEDSEPETYFCRKSNSTGQLAEKVSPPPPAATNISCLRQMYCPECNERLHEQGVRLERLLTMCCFAMLPIYPCCPRRTNNDCRVICGKCGYLLGAWKRQ